MVKGSRPIFRTVKVLLASSASGLHRTGRGYTVWLTIFYFVRPSAQVSRRLSFVTPNSYARTHGNDLFVPESPARGRYWRPGEILPTTSVTPSGPPAEPSIESMIQALQSSIDGNFRGVKTQLAEIDHRVHAMEEKQKQFDLQQSTPSSSSSSEDSVAGRKCRSPSELQAQYTHSCSMRLEVFTLLWTKRTNCCQMKGVIILLPRFVLCYVILMIVAELMVNTKEKLWIV